MLHNMINNCFWKIIQKENFKTCFKYMKQKLEFGGKNKQKSRKKTKTKLLNSLDYSCTYIKFKRRITLVRQLS